MACYHPIPAWYAQRVNPSGRRGIVFNLKDGFVDKPLSLPCGTCIGCRLEKARQWAVRCGHEMKLYDSNLFVTLTYDDEHVASNGSLRPRDYVLFMKRLRHVVPGVRFFQCGEYGETSERPHHHAILFNCDFDDRVRYSGSGEHQLYESRKLNELWGQGTCLFAGATFETAGYVARYTVKKLGLSGMDYRERLPEYLTMSRRPGIGREWALKYMHQWYRDDYVVVNGHKAMPGRYYDSLLERKAPERYRELKALRRATMVDDPDSTGRRLVEREVVKEGAISRMTRSMEV